MAGRTRIEKNRLEQLNKIETNRKEALAKLNTKYAAADKVKTSFGLIGITFLSVLWSLIILNDLSKLFYFFYEELKEETGKLRTEEEEHSRVKIQLELDEKDDDHYAQDLEEKLEKFHWKLVKACASRRNLQK